MANTIEVVITGLSIIFILMIIQIFVLNDAIIGSVVPAFRTQVNSSSANLPVEDVNIINAAYDQLLFLLNLVIYTLYLGIIIWMFIKIVKSDEPPQIQGGQ